MINVDLDFYSKFITALKTIVPEKGQLAVSLAEILHIEKVAVYRRLRGEVPFTFAEIVQISKRLNLSMDEIIGVTPEYQGIPFYLNFHNYFNLVEDNYKMLDSYVESVKPSLRNRQPSELGSASLFLSKCWAIMHSEVFKFFVMKWLYQFGNNVDVVPYSKIILPDWLETRNVEYTNLIKEIDYSYYIFHENAFVSIVRDIQYFNAIKLISDEDIIVLKEALAKLLDTMEDIARKGEYENGNKVELYVSSLNFDNSYGYFYSNNVNIGLIDVFSINTVTSSNSIACEKIRTWLQAIKRSSMLISNSEINRITYFEKQRKILSIL